MMRKILIKVFVPGLFILPSLAMAQQQSLFVKSLTEKKVAEYQAVTCSGRSKISTPRSRRRRMLVLMA